MIGNGRLRETDRNLYEQAHPEVPGFLHMQNPAPENPGGRRGLSRVPLRLSYGRLLEEPWILRVYPMVFDDIEGGRWWRSRSYGSKKNPLIDRVNHSLLHTPSY